MEDFPSNPPPYQGQNILEWQLRQVEKWKASIQLKS